MLLAVLLSATGRTLRAEVIGSYPALESILGDSLRTEDFEGINLAGGTSIVAPDPLSSASAPPNWGIQPGVTYSSPTSLAFYTGQLLGDDSNILAARGNAVSNTMNVTFANPQLAVGFYLVNITGNLDYSETVNFYRNATVLEEFSVTLSSASELFIGRQFLAGITSVQVTSSAFALVDNISWGVTATAPLGDYNRNGVVDTADYVLWRKNPDLYGGAPDGYNAWRANFGQGAGNGVGASANTAVPEPTTLVLLMLAAVCWFLRPRRAAWKAQQLVKA